MKPIINQVKLSSLSSRQKEKICECEVPCTKAYSITTYNDGFIMCLVDTRKFFYDLIKQLDESIPTTWTAEDEQYLINHYKENGVYNGINRVIGDTLGKTPKQVKTKVSLLRKKGLIERN